MNTVLNLARLSKLVALLGFVLPWVLVSCAGEPVGRLSGIDMVTGGLTMHDAAHGALPSPRAGPNLWVALSLAAVIVWIVASFLMVGRQAILAMVAAAIVALGASAIGGTNLQYGYFITVAGLLASIGARGIALTRWEGGAAS